MKMGSSRYHVCCLQADPQRAEADFGALRFDVGGCSQLRSSGRWVSPKWAQTGSTADAMIADLRLQGGDHLPDGLEDRGGLVPVDVVAAVGNDLEDAVGGQCGEFLLHLP